MYITGKRMDGYGHHHQHITHVRWDNGSQSDICTRQDMVNHIRKGNDVWVKDQYGKVQVGVVDGTPPYLRTHKDGRYTDNLLSLPDV